ncbi:MAG TPA: ABC transporter permease [Longimicrobiales bacterium]
MMRDLRFAFRSLARRPGLLATAVLSLAFGIGVNVVLYGVVDVILFRAPPGVVEPERVVRVEPGAGAVPGLLAPSASPSVSYPQFEAARAGTRLFSGIAAYAPLNVSEGAGVQADRLDAILASEEYFAVLGVRPFVGRFFSEEDGRGTAGAPVAVISHEYWERRFGRDTGVLGRTLMLNGVAVTIVGVAPPGFRGVDLGRPDVWLPLWLAGTDAFGSPSSFTGRMFWLRMIGRLRPAVPAERPEALSERVEAPGVPGGELVITARELRTQFGADQRGRNPIPLWLLAVSATAFLIACTTVGHLLLASAVERAGEFAVRFAMGARTRDIVRLLVAEAAIVAALGAAVALLAALWSTRLLRVLPLPPIDGLVDGRVVVLAVLGAVAAVALCVVGSAVWVRRHELADALKGAQRSASRGGRVQAALVAVQVAACGALLICGGLYVRSLQKALAIDPGFAVDELLVARVDRLGALGGAYAAEFLARGAERVRSLPGARGAARASIVPFYSFTTYGYEAQGGDDPDAGGASGVTAFVDAEYFRTFGIPRRAGRVFDENDRAGGEPVAVLSLAMARELWPGGNALGRCIVVSVGPAAGECIRVVGLVDDVRFQDVTGPSTAVVYRPIAQRPEGMALSLFIRGDDVRRLAPVVRRELQALDPAAPAVHVEPLAARLRPQFLEWEVAGKVFGALGGVTALLAALGVYIAVSGMVGRQTRELGVRAALGATAGAILRLVLARTARLAAAGVIAGAVLAFAATGVLPTPLFGVGRLDPPAYAFAGGMLLAFALAAALASATRAARVSPAESLRVE